MATAGRPMSATMRTDRMVLRPIERTDAEALHRIFGDPAVMKFWYKPCHASLAETEAWVSETIELRERREWHDFAAIHDDALIGRVAIREGEIGCLFRRSAWGRGFAEEAVAAVLDYAFETLAMPSIKADVDPGNDRSLRMVARLGFRRTGSAEKTYWVGDHWLDSVIFELAASDHRARR
jgi:RimJ/RimL family protein N-acetyltransferase